MLIFILYILQLEDALEDKDGVTAGVNTRTEFSHIHYGLKLLLHNPVIVHTVKHN